MTAPRKLTSREARQIGRRIGDFFVAMGHPLTCNGGNPDVRKHVHDREVEMLFNGTALICPECGRVQSLPDNVLAKE